MALLKLSELFFCYIISQTGATNFLESYLLGDFFSILVRQRIAFFLTVTETLLVRAISMILSATEATSVSGTIVAIIENARD